MNYTIEVFDKQRMRFLRAYLWAFVFAAGLMMTRYFLRESGVNDRPAGYAIIVGAGIAVLIMAILVLKQASLAKQIDADPDLKDALNNEVVQLLELRSWKAACFGSVATIVFFAVTTIFYPVFDMVLFALMSILMGAGAHRAYFYFKYRAL